MKKAIVSAMLLAVVMVACTPKASPSVTEATIPTESAVSKSSATISAGHTLFTTKCTRCHGQKPVEKWTYEELRPVLASMVKKAKLDKTETEQVSAYVYSRAKK
jgi:uncharacterized membrane protein